MKWIIYLLLLANLAVFVWYFQWGEKPEAGTAALPREVEESPRLVLRGERDAQRASAAAPGSGAGSGVEHQAPSPQCYTVGPFARSKLAGEAARRLEVLGIEARQRMSSDSSRDGYWVMIAPAASRAAARKTVRKLKDEGIKDYFRVATGDWTNAVSLGVFSRPDLARRRLEQITALGFAPRIEQVALPKREYWLDWPIESGRLLSRKELAALQKRYPGIGQVSRLCPE